MHAEDALMRLRMTRRMRTYTESPTRTSPPNSPASTAWSADVDATAATYDVVQQFNQSDLAFLRERARLIQAELWCTGSTLHFPHPGRAGRAPRSPWSSGNQLLSRGSAPISRTSGAR